MAAIPAGAGATPVAFGGNPLTVSIDSLGQCQTSYAGFGGNFYPGSSPTGDCGFFIATPTAPTTGTSPQPADLQKKEFGFDGNAGPHGLTPYTPGTDPRTVTGSGTAADPFKLVTVYYVDQPGGAVNAHVLQVTQTDTYISGNAFYTASWDVKNVTNLLPAASSDRNKTVYYRSMFAGDLFVNGDDHGTGVFLAGPPRFIGGQNATSGVLGGFQETATASDGSAVPPWTNYQQLDYPTVWSTVETSADMPAVWNNTVNPNNVDDAAGVSWDTNYTTGLAPGADQHYAVVNFTTVPSALSVAPVSQAVPVGTPAVIAVTARNTSGAGYANSPVRYTIAGANPQSGSVTTNAAGQAQIAYVGQNPGVDLVRMFVDLAGNGVQTAGDPAGSAQVTFVQAPPNSTITVQRVQVNSNGTITIFYTPSQDGTALLSVTVPSAGIAKNVTAAAKRCKRGRVKIRGRCVPRNSVYGSAVAPGRAGVPLSISVNPSAKARNALRKGRTFRVTATLSYRSARGGAPSVHVFSLRVKGKKKK